MSEVIQLPIHEDYVKDWGIWEAVRELLQNAIDSSLETGEDFQFFTHMGEDPSIEIKTMGASLARRTLVLGCSEKADNSIGQFGEGYKLALLVLTRMGKEVIITQLEEVWTVSMEYSSVFDTKILTITIIEREPMESDEFIHIRINNLEPEDIELINERYMPCQTEAKIIEDRPGEIFLHGLYVTTIEEMEYGYNFKVGQIPINRDRNMSITFNVQCAAAVLHDEHTEPEVILDKLIEQKADVEYYHYYAGSKPKVIAAFQTKYPDIVPVADEKDIEKLEPGVKYKVVPRTLRDLLHKAGDFVSKMIRRDPLHVRLENWRAKVASKLSADELKEFNDLIAELKPKKDDIQF